MTTTLDVISTSRQQGRTLLTEVEAKQFLAAAGIPVVPTFEARSRTQAVALARQVGFPAALKVVSPDIVHKSDVGGVKLGLSSQRQVQIAYDEIMASAQQKAPGAKVWGVSVQKMARPGTEVIVGMSKDVQFGPVLMFGLGGILVEVLQDVAFRIVPLTAFDAREMVRDIKGFPVLQGVRGHEPAHLESLERILLQVSQLVEATPAIKELDLNPIFVYRDSAVAVDARIVLEPEG